MTVSKALINWLYGFGDIAIDEEISTEQLAAQAEAYGLYKDQQTSIHCYVDGTRDVTAYYLLLARQPAQAERQRQDAQAWLEGLERWVRQKSMAGELPELQHGRECQRVGVSGSFTMQDASTGDAVYQLTLEINYIDKGEAV